jgi:redox-sensitive bicupin YhaK (pirin superfamily)
MITIRKASERGHADHGWLKSHHSFSFANYHDPEHMGFRALRVINDDRVAGGQGFGSHSHQNMEIVSYVLAGALAHKDSTGTQAVIRPGDVQRMSAGTGVTHSEFNASPTDEAHFLQIWIEPTQRGLKPSYEQKAFTDSERRGRLRLVASPNARDSSLGIHADANIYAGLLAAGETAELALAPKRAAWAHLARGKARINGLELGEGDGVALTDETQLRIEGIEEAEVLVFDLA